MIRIKGFDSAKPLLTRSVPSELSQAGTTGPAVEQTVRNIISDVRERGDIALFEYAKEFDGVTLASLEVTPDEIAEAYRKVDETLITALRLAARRISNFHDAVKQRTGTSFLEGGVGRKVRPLQRIGIYVPGGTAAYPSTVLMAAIPARVAGVEEIIMTTPATADGMISPATLVAADMAKVDQIFKTGGAQAIAALALGTESIPRVDKICGPGNIYVATAKRLVYGTVAIDGIQGPSEVIVVADDTADASLCAADLLAQAEHDSMASAIFITTSEKLADDVEKEIMEQTAILERRVIVAESINERGMIIQVNTPSEAIELVNIYAPEHLLLMMNDAEARADQVRNAGCIFIGSNSPVTLGDYVAGPSHVLPTDGSARFSSPLSIEDFLKITSIVSFDDDTSRELGQKAIDIAEAEGLTGHVKAMERRLKRKRKD
jgi:histidinol dehydrogenase